MRTWECIEIGRSLPLRTWECIEIGGSLPLRTWECIEIGGSLPLREGHPRVYSQTLKGTHKYGNLHICKTIFFYLI